MTGSRDLDHHHVEVPKALVGVGMVRVICFATENTPITEVGIYSLEKCLSSGR
ncbi:MAG: hypothetical protein ACFFD4_26805 [Candidatus Odinarchaeota archaeon]